MVEILLRFIHATRQGLWDLHLTTLDEMVKYFFALDLKNYTGLSLVYLSQMYALKDEDPVTWKFFEDSNFAVNKSDVPFSAIGVDHGIEHENRMMKVIGGIIGIANKENAIE